MSSSFLNSLGIVSGAVRKSSRENAALHREVTEVFQTYRAPVFRYVYSIVGDAAEAEDTAQEAFLRYYREVRDGRDIAPRPWLFRVAHNLAIDRVRTRAKWTTLPGADWANLDETHEDERLDIHSDVLWRERRRKLQAISAELSERERSCIALRLEGLRYREIAATLGVGVSTVENYLSRAVRKVMRELDG